MDLDNVQMCPMALSLEKVLSCRFYECSASNCAGIVAASFGDVQGVAPSALDTRALSCRHGRTCEPQGSGGDVCPRAPSAGGGGGG